MANISVMEHSDGIHGSSPTVLPAYPGANAIKASADHMSFAPAPCVCCSCLVPDAVRKRTYWNVYANRIEINHPSAAYLCCTPDIRVRDRIYVSYFDKPPHRAHAAPCPFCFIPCTCCGPPVIFVGKHYFCCIDCTPCFGETIKECFGETIKYAPCNLFGLKMCLCCGKPCYTRCSLPIVSGLNNTGRFIGAYQAAVAEFNSRTGLPQDEMVIFESNQDGVLVPERVLRQELEHRGLRSIEVGLLEAEQMHARKT